MPAPALNDLDRVEQRLRRWQSSQPMCVDLGAIHGQPIHPPFEALHVPLDVFDGGPDGEALSAEELRALALLEQGGPGAVDASLRVDVARQNRWLKMAGTRRPLETVLARTPCMVLLGDPGSGKSLALERLMRAQPDPASGSVPVLIRLAACDELLTGAAEDMDLFDLVERIYRSQGHPDVGALARARFDEGRLILLLDGLDEVIHRETRGWLASRIRALFDEAGWNGSRIVVSSRGIGYREAPIVGAPEFMLAPLRSDDVKTFVGKLYRWLGAFLDVPEPEARARADVLTHEIRARTELQDLAAVPLHLVHLALLRWEVVALPQSQVVLYEQMLRRLVRDWTQARSQGARRRPTPTVDPIRMIHGLKVLAFELHQHWASGTAPEEEVLAILSRALRKADVPDPTPAAQALLEDARRRAGVLVERAQHRFGFLHLSLEDYLAGQALAERGAKDALGFLRDHHLLHDPRWQIPLRLAVAGLGQISGGSLVARELILGILDACSPHERHFHRDLLLAAELAGEQVDLGDLRDALVEREDASGPPTDATAWRLMDLLGSNVPPLRWEAARRLGLLARAGSTRAEDRLCTWMKTTRDLSSAEALIPLLRAPRLSRVREVIRARVESAEDLQVGQLLVRKAPVDPEDLNLVVGWSHKIIGSNYHFARIVWTCLARLTRDSSLVRAAVLEELRRPDGELPMPPAEALKEDPELCQALFHRWVSYGRLGADHVAMALGEALAAQGVPAEDVLGPIQEHWSDSGHVVHALQAYHHHPEVRRFLWSVVDGAPASPSGAVLAVLAKGAGEADVTRMVSGLRACPQAGWQGWVMGLTRVPETPEVTAALDHVLSSTHDTAKQEVVRARMATAPDETLIGWVRDGSPTVRDTILPELERRMDRPAVTEALRSMLRGDPAHRSARSWAWAPLLTFYEQDERVRQRFAEAVANGDEEACRWLALETGAPSALRVQAVGKLQQHLHWTLLAGGDELIALIAEANAGLDVLRRLCEGVGVRTGLLRGALTRALLPRVGGRALLAVAGEAPLHVLGDMYDVLSEEVQLSLNKVWTESILWMRGAPPLQVPVVMDVIVTGLLDRDRYMLRWAPLLGADLHTVEGVTDALRAACLDADGQTRVAALRCLGLQEALTAEDVQILRTCTADPSRNVQREALDQLMVHAPTDSADIFRGLIAHRDADLRHRAALGLVAAGALQGSEALPWLGIHEDVSIFYGEDPLDGVEMRWRVASSVAARIPEDLALREQVEALLDDPRWTVRQGAALVLLQGEVPSTLVDRLLAGLADHRTEEVSFTQTRCARALLNHAKPEVRDEALTLLLRGLRCGLDPARDALYFETLRQHCARTLGDTELLTWDPRADEALRDALDDPGEHVRGEAWRALRRVLRAPRSLHPR